MLFINDKKRFVFAVQIPTMGGKSALFDALWRVGESTPGLVAYHPRTSCVLVDADALVSCIARRICANGVKLYYGTESANWNDADSAFRREVDRLMLLELDDIDGLDLARRIPIVIMSADAICGVQTIATAARTNSLYVAHDKRDKPTHNPITGDDARYVSLNDIHLIVSRLSAGVKFAQSHFGVNNLIARDGNPIGVLITWSCGPNIELGCDTFTSAMTQWSIYRDDSSLLKTETLRARAVATDVNTHDAVASVHATTSDLQEQSVAKRGAVEPARSSFSALAAKLFAPSLLLVMLLLCGVVGCQRPRDLNNHGVSECSLVYDTSTVTTDRTTMTRMARYRDSCIKYDILPECVACCLPFVFWDDSSSRVLKTRVYNLMFETLFDSFIEENVEGDA